MHLSQADVEFCQYLHSYMLQDVIIAHFTLGMLPPLILLSVLIQNNVIIPAIPNVAIAVNCLVHIQHAQSIVSRTYLSRWFEIDHLCHYFPLEEEEDNKGHQLLHQNV